MHNRRRPPKLESRSRLQVPSGNKAGNDGRIDGWRGVSEESVAREVCHHLKWAQGMKEMYERQVAACEKQLQEHRLHNSVLSEVDAVGKVKVGLEYGLPPTGLRELPESRLPSSRCTSGRRKSRRQPPSSRRRSREECSKLPHEKLQSKQAARAPSKGNNFKLPIMHGPPGTPANGTLIGTPQRSPSMNLVQLPALRTPSSAKKVAEGLQLRQTVRPGLQVQHLLQVQVSEVLQGPSLFESDGWTAAVERVANGVQREKKRLQKCDAQAASPPSQPIMGMASTLAQTFEDQQQDIKHEAQSLMGRDKKTKRDAKQPKPARKKRRGNRVVQFATGATASAANGRVLDVGAKPKSSEATGAKDIGASCDVDSDSADNASDASEPPVPMPRPIGRSTGSLRRNAVKSFSIEATKEMLSFNPRVATWRSIFKRLQDDGEVHRDMGPWAMQLAGYPKPNVEWVNEILRDLTPYSTLDLEEFMFLMESYEHREHDGFAKMFADYDLDRSGTIDRCELPLLIAAFGVTPMDHVIDEVVKDVAPADDDDLTFDEFWQVIINLRMNEGFSKSEVEKFKLLFKKFDVDQSGTLDCKELHRMLRYMGYAMNQQVTQSILHEVDVDRNGSLDEREFLVCMRKVREHEVGKVQAIFRKCDADNSGGISYKELLMVLRSLGYFPDEPEIKDAYEDAGLDPGTEMSAGDLWRFLKMYRDREGFSRAEMQEIATVFERFDADGDGELSVFEVVHMFAELGMPISCNAAQRFVSSVDIDGSGSIDLHEFTKITRQRFEDQATRARDVFCSHAKENLQQSVGDAMLQSLIPGACRNDRSKTIEDLNLVQKQGGEVNEYQFVRHIKKLQSKTRLKLLENQCFSEGEVVDLRERFDQFDVGRKSFLAKREVQNLLEHLFPKLATCAAQRPQLVKIMQDANIQGSIDFDCFLKLARRCGELSARAALQREQEAIAKVGFSAAEVHEFRDLFMGGGSSEHLSLVQIQDMLSQIIPMGYKNSEAVAKVFREIVVEKDGKREAEFSEFLLVIRHLIDSDVACINKFASGMCAQAELT